MNECKILKDMHYTLKYLPILPKMMPFSVDATFTLALMLQKSCPAKVTGEGFSTNLRSPANLSVIENI
jgi:hypothetical protein